MEKLCPFPTADSRCQSQVQNRSDGYANVSCKLCGRCAIDSRLVRASTTLNDWYGALGAVRELQYREVDLPFLTWVDGSYAPKVTGTDFDGNHQDVSIPNGIKEKASRLLTALVAQSKHYRQIVKLQALEDFPLAYAKNAEEFLFFVDYLVEAAYVERISHCDSKSVELRVTPKGYEAQQQSVLHKTLSVFISSTCFDLIDCRAELASHLESRAHIVFASDDPTKFDLPDHGNSIVSCLHNVSRSDVVVCIIDGRFGPTLEKYGYPGKSATQVEVEHAKELKIPVRYFLRKQVAIEYDLLRKSQHNSDLPETRRIEPSSKHRKEQWLDFVSSCIGVPDSSTTNNWFDQFESVVDLKKIVDKRLQGIEPKNRRPN